MMRAAKVLRAATAYWALVFALGFVLGSLRVTLLAPAIGLLGATALELPVMLAASWLAAGWLLRRLALSGESEALAAGGLAFALLMAAECVLAVSLMDQSPRQWLAGLAEPHAALGLAGQIAFALMPWLRVRRAA